MINLRPATISDAEALVHVHHAAVHGSAPSTFYTPDIRQTWSPSPTDQYRVNQFRQATENSKELLVVDCEATERNHVKGNYIVLTLSKHYKL